MIQTAKCCLQQLKAHARLISHNHTRLGGDLASNSGRNGGEHDHLSNYYTLSTRYDGVQSATNNSPNQQHHHHLHHHHHHNAAMGNTVELSCSRHLISSEMYSSNSSIGGSSTLDYHQQRIPINEKPPSYESIIKSSSLPSYCHFSTTDEKTSKCVKK